MGTLVSVVLPGLVVIPFVLYGVLWIDPAYDLLGLGNYLPSAMLPSSMNKKLARAPIPQPPLQSPAGSETSPAGGPAEGAVRHP